MTRSFELVPLSTGLVALGIACGLFIAALGATLLYMVLGVRRMKFIASESGLRIRAPFYSRTIARAKLQLDAARVIEDGAPNPHSFSRRNGMVLPGQRVGWYRHKDAKALLFLGSKQPPLMIPTSDGYAVYLTPERPQELLEALRSSRGETMSTSPGSRLGMILFLPLAAVVLTLSLAFAYFVIGPKKTALSATSITVSGALYGKTTPRAELLVDQARLVDLSVDRQLAPTSKSNGFDFFSYKEGWFRLRSGDKALLVVSDKHKVVYIPTRAGYALLFSAADPAGLLAALKQ